MLGYSTSAQYTGQVVGPLAGGFVGGHFGMREVFFGTSALMIAGALYNWILKSGILHKTADSTPGGAAGQARKEP
jgi:MFS family permease